LNSVGDAGAARDARSRCERASSRGQRRTCQEEHRREGERESGGDIPAVAEEPGPYADQVQPARLQREQRQEAGCSAAGAQGVCAVQGGEQCLPPVRKPLENWPLTSAFFLLLLLLFLGFVEFCICKIEK